MVKAPDVSKDVPTVQWLRNMAEMCETTAAEWKECYEQEEDEFVECQMKNAEKLRESASKIESLQYYNSELVESLKEVAPKCTNVPLHDSGKANVATYRYSGHESIQYACDECIDIIGDGIADYESWQEGARAKEAIAMAMAKDLEGDV